MREKPECFKQLLIDNALVWLMIIHNAFWFIPDSGVVLTYTKTVKSRNIYISSNIALVKINTQYSEVLLDTFKYNLYIFFTTILIININFKLPMKNLFNKLNR